MKIFGWLVRRYQLETMFRGEVRTLQIDDSKIKPLRDALSITNGRRLLWDLGNGVVDFYLA